MKTLSDKQHATIKENMRAIPKASYTDIDRTAVLKEEYAEFIKNINESDKPE